MPARSHEAIARKIANRKARTAEQAAARRRPCMQCGGTKGPGRARRLCEPCTSAGLVWCSACQSFKDRSEFHPTTSRSTGVATYCKVCAVTRNREHRYGFERGEFARRVALQDGRCAACRVEVPIDEWHVDHDHACCPAKGRSCGKCIRDLLCRTCNLALGLIDEDVERARGLAAYLTRWQE